MRLIELFMNPPSQITHPHSFTMVEVLVVVSIISVMAALLLPATQKVKEVARAAQCQNNVRQIGMAMLMYAQEDPNEKLPNFLDYAFTAPPAGASNFWYWQRLAYYHYLPEPIPATGPTNGVWRCPLVRTSDILWGGGYGPSGGEDTTGHGSVINFGDAPHELGGFGSIPLGRLNHRATTWLIGDAGRPKSSTIPEGGYYTWPSVLVPFLPDFAGNSQQAACRHRGRANVCMVDGHMESWTYGDLASNKFDIFCQDSY